MGLLDGLFGPKGSEDRLQAKMSLMGLTHRPNQQLMAQWSNDLANMRDERKATEKSNRTLEWMRTQAAQYPQLAPLLGAMETGGIDTGAAVNAAFQIIQEANKPAPVAEPVKGVVVGGVLRNPYTGEVIGEAPPDNTNATVAWLRQQGRDDLAAAVESGVLPALEAAKEATERTTPLVEINEGNENSGAFNKKADEAAAARFDQYIQGGNDATRMMGDIQTLTALGTQIETGATAEAMAALGPYAEALGIDVAGLDAAQAYKAIVDRMAPAMRPAGSGASSDFDARQFLSSLPSLGRTPEGNRIILDTLSAIQQHKIAAAEIAARALLPPDDPSRMTWQQAEAEIRRLGNPYDAFNEYRKRAPKPTVSASPDAPDNSIPTYNAETGMWE